ncbi:hypothetical protein [Streptomyces sp. AK08-02]|uniref:hypothetical protein n=1 Tax=Streptomyces sp. AK08-02 TaxID=3028654 RepID=UPI0029BF10B7|nr:hypothetical protein [Streptomyces sp. AK08-02]MDX3749643.1 hypothetical protein [Streptomyces sp. AK08-02]
MNITRIAAIVVAAHVLGAPIKRQETGGRTVRVLSLRGQRFGQVCDFTLDDGHRRWRLETVTDNHGVDMVGRTLGKRLSARLDVLHAQATEHFTQRSTPE